jgi:hypothetical protein
MGKSNDRNATAEQEFASLEKVLNQTADDAARCLKLLKKNLSDYDSRHGNHFINTATSYLRSDMRTAKDTAADLKHVAHQINRSSTPSESEVHSAHNMMGATAKAMDVLNTTARNYDEKNGRSKGVKGAIDNVVGNNDQQKDEQHGGGLFGKDNKTKDEKHIGLFGKDEKKDEKHTGLFGKDKDEKHTGLFGKDKDKDKESKVGGLFGKSDKDKEDKHTGLLGKGDKHKDEKHGTGLLGGKGEQKHHGGDGLLGSSDTVEALVKATLRDNFNLSPLSHQITIAEKSLTASPTFVERAKEAVNEVKDKLKGDKASPTRGDHHANKRAVTP